MVAPVGRFALAAAVAALAAEGVMAQAPPDSADGGGSPPGSAWRFLSDSSRSGWLRPLASLAVPGVGQLMGRSERGALYLVTEAFFLTRFLSLQHDARVEADRYRDLAFTIARGAFSPQTRDTLFDYFEAMGKYVESGPFDGDPGPAFVPPADERTFNGRIWLLARETFFANPDSVPDTSSVEYGRAMSFYRSRAVGPDFRWSWRGAALEQDVYRQTIRSSDEAFRHARAQLGLLLANHLLSAVDALVTGRLGRPNGRRLSGSLRVERSLLSPRFELRVLTTF